jgi:virginiamycin B lyase
MRNAVVALAVVAIIVAGSFASYELYFVPGQGLFHSASASTTTTQCKTTTSTVTTTRGLKATTFGAVEEYALPGASPWANGITVASDGSVWFGEQGVPGLGHLYPNTGTLVEYRWPCYPTSSTGGPVSSIWGVALWNGGVWAADGDSNRLVGLNPSTGSTTYVNTTSAEFPYLLSVSPDGSLWFSSLARHATIGRLGTDMKLSVYSVEGLGHQEPIQIQFINSTFAYMVSLDPYNDTDSGLYSFDPSTSGSAVVANKVGGDQVLLYPQALAMTDDTIWISPHFPSHIVSYDTTTGTWTVYPTPSSEIPHLSTTLPYFVEASGDKVWFNEHQGNKIALLDPSAGTLTEYSEANPPVTSTLEIQNDLTIAAVPEGLWFASMTGDYIGFVNGSSQPGFSIAVSGSNTVSVAPGGRLSLSFQVSGAWSTSLVVRVSDSENYTSVPSLISMVPDTPSLSAGYGTVTVSVTVGAAEALQPGRYTLAVTVDGGLVAQTAYVFLTVT